MRFTAVWNDGKSPVQVPVEVDAAPDGLRFFLPASSNLVLWPYNDLRKKLDASAPPRLFRGLESLTITNNVLPPQIQYVKGEQLLGSPIFWIAVWVVGVASIIALVLYLLSTMNSVYRPWRRQPVAMAQPAAASIVPGLPSSRPATLADRQDDPTAIAAHPPA